MQGLRDPVHGEAYGLVGGDEGGGAAGEEGDDEGLGHDPAPAVAGRPGGAPAAPGAGAAGGPGRRGHRVEPAPAASGAGADACGGGDRGLARAEIDALLAQGRTPVLVGGSGLYVRGALDAMDFPGTDPEVLARLEAEAPLRGPGALHARLAGADPAAAPAILPRHRRHPRDRREAQLRPLRELPHRVPDGVPPHQRLDRPQGRLRHHHDLPLAPHQRGRRDPAPQRVLARPQIGPGQHGPAVQQQRRRVPGARRDRLRAGRAHDQRGPVRHLVQDVVAPGGPYRHRRKRTPQLLRGAPGADHLGPQPERPALLAVPGALLAPAPAAVQVPLVGGLQRPRADRAAGRRAAPLARQAGHVAPPGNLDEDGPGLETLPHGLPRQARQPRGPRRAVPGEQFVADGPDPGRVRPYRLPVGGQRPGPAGLDELRGLHRATGAPGQEGAAVGDRAQLQHLPDVREGGAVVAVAGVAVVPDRDQSEVPYGREHRGPGADDGPHRSPADGEPLPVALLGPRLGGQQRVPALAEQGGQGGVDAGRGAPVGDHGEGPAAGGQGRGHGAGQFVGPAGAGQRGPHGARDSAGGQGPQEGGARSVPLPARGLGRGGRGQRFGGRLGLGAGAARGQRELEHVGEAAGVPVGHGAGQGEHAGA
nr:tRNA dimethylallyltransferase [Streptomyces sp. ICC4]